MLFKYLGNLVLLAPFSLPLGKLKKKKKRFSDAVSFLAGKVRNLSLPPSNWFSFSLPSKEFNISCCVSYFSGLDVPHTSSLIFNHRFYECL